MREIEGYQRWKARDNREALWLTVSDRTAYGSRSRSHETHLRVLINSLILININGRQVSEEARWHRIKTNIRMFARVEYEISSRGENTFQRDYCWSTVSVHQSSSFSSINFFHSKCSTFRNLKDSCFCISAQIPSFIIAGTANQLPKQRYLAWPEDEIKTVTEGTIFLLGRHDSSSDYHNCLFTVVDRKKSQVTSGGHPLPRSQGQLYRYWTSKTHEGSTWYRRLRHEKKSRPVAVTFRLPLRRSFISLFISPKC